MTDALDRSRALSLRRVLFQTHLWTGLLVGLYVTVVCASGSVLVFRSDLQRAAFPELLASDHAGPPADIIDVFETISEAFPGQRISGLEAPTRFRRTYLAYVADGRDFRTVLADPATGRVLGELPKHSWIASLQSLHFNLLLGKTGRILNQVAALGLLCLALSGSIIWWQGRRRWTRGLRLRGGPWPDVLRNLHSASGAWGWLVVLMISLTACSLMFPRQFRSLVGAGAPALQAAPQPRLGMDQPALTAAQIIRLARESHAEEHIARVVLPAKPGATYQVSFAHVRPTPLTPAAQVIRHFDPATGVETTHTNSGLSGDRIVSWAIALHVGNFAGNATRIGWAILGLMPPLLFVTGALLWWRRVVRPWRARAS